MYICIIIIHTYVATYVYAWTKCCFWDFSHNLLASSKIYIYNKLLHTLNVAGEEIHNTVCQSILLLEILFKVTNKIMNTNYTYHTVNTN